MCRWPALHLEPAIDLLPSLALSRAQSHEPSGSAKRHMIAVIEKSWLTKNGWCRLLEVLHMTAVMTKNIIKSIRYESSAAIALQRSGVRFPSAPPARRAGHPGDVQAPGSRTP